MDEAVLKKRKSRSGAHWVRRSGQKKSVRSACTAKRASMLIRKFIENRNLYPKKGETTRLKAGWLAQRNAFSKRTVCGCKDEVCPITGG